MTDPSFVLCTLDSPTHSLWLSLSFLKRISSVSLSLSVYLSNYLNISLLSGGFLTPPVDHLFISLTLYISVSFFLSPSVYLFIYLSALSGGFPTPPVYHPLIFLTLSCCLIDIPSLSFTLCLMFFSLSILSVFFLSITY